MTPSQLKLFEKIIDKIDSRADLESAELDLDNLLADNIEPPMTYYVLGSLYLLKKRAGHAIFFLEKAAELKPNEYQILINLGTAYQNAGFPQKALDCYEKSAKIEGKPYPFINTTNSLLKLGRYTEARDLACKGIHEGHKETELLHNLSHALLHLGEYEDGFEFNETRLYLSESPSKLHKVNMPFWDGKSEDKIVVYEEQGLGDEIMFASLLADISKTNEIVYDCNPRLYDLMKRSFPEIEVITHEPSEVADYYSTRSDIKYKVPIGSLAKFYRKKEGDFPKVPYLKADPLLVEKYRIKLAELGHEPKVGFSWYGGGKSRERVMSRFNALSNWLGVFELPCEFISLQYGPEAESKIKNFCEKSDVNLYHWPDILADLDHTAALLMSLDYVVSAPQTVVHLAGALGVPTMRLCAKNALWMHGEYNKDAPWYGSVKNIWQEEYGDWSPVMQKVKQQLEKICFG